MNDTFTIGSRVFQFAQLREAVDWKRDCESIPDSVFVSFHGALRYVERNYPGGWGAFVAECCTFVQL